MTSLPPAPPNEDRADACCGSCGSLWHTSDGHAGSTVESLVAAPEFPPGYDPTEADRLIGRVPTEGEERSGPQ